MTSKNNETALEDKVEDNYAIDKSLDMFKPLYHELNENKDNPYLPAKKNFNYSFLKKSDIKEHKNINYTSFILSEHVCRRVE